MGRAVGIDVVRAEARVYGFIYVCRRPIGLTLIDSPYRYYAHVALNLADISRTDGVEIACP